MSLNLIIGPMTCGKTRTFIDQSKKLLLDSLESFFFEK